MMDFHKQKGVTMTLEQFFADKPRGAKIALARHLGITKQWMAAIITGRGLASAEVCAAIERYTKGKVLRATLRPDLFGELK
jgi:DNA-binding transcriptional regulator YdaS (Cro superfamily)